MLDQVTSLGATNNINANAVSGPVQRDSNGQLMQGSRLNPNGSVGKQIFSKAALNAIFDDFLMEYSLLEITTLANDEIARGKLSTAKGLVLARIMDALKSGGGQDFDRIMDRKHGKVTGDSANVQINMMPTRIELVVVPLAGQQASEPITIDVSNETAPVTNDDK